MILGVYNKTITVIKDVQPLSMQSGEYNNIYQCHQGCTASFINVIGVQQHLSMLSGVYNNLFQWYQSCTISVQVSIGNNLF